METSPAGENEGRSAGASPAAMTQAGRMRAAVDQTVALAPRFLRGEVDANHMARTMVKAVTDYVDEERTRGDDGTAQDAHAQALQATLAELMACGSGYLAGRCDAACVARTMTQMVREFPPR